MPAELCRAEESVLVLVDLQPSFLSGIVERERIEARCLFLAQTAKMLDVPILATVQNEARMGGLSRQFEAVLDGQAPAMDKMAFSCVGCAGFNEALKKLGWAQVVLVGIETHICVSQTALDLISRDYRVIVASDAVGARSHDRNESGLARMRAAGATLAHSEAIAYEWMRSADHPRFREALELVKSSS